MNHIGYRSLWDALDLDRSIEATERAKAKLEEQFGDPNCSALILWNNCTHWPHGHPQLEGK